MLLDRYWLQFYSNEEELIKAIESINVQKYNELCSKDICSGYQYVTRTARAVQSGQTLSSAQMRMVKRLAKQIYKYHLYK